MTTNHDALREALEACDVPEQYRHAIMDKLAALAASNPEPKCRQDGRCQYAIDHGAEGLGHCPPGKCAMPEPQAQAGEPDGIVEQQAVYEVCLAHWGPDNGVTVDAKAVLELLKSHREAIAEVTRRFEELKRHGVPYHVHNAAIAKRDAALQACLEVMEYTGGQHPITKSAITQAQEALK